MTPNPWRTALPAFVFLMPGAIVRAADPAMPFYSHFQETCDALPASGSISLTGTGGAGAQGPIPGMPGWQATRAAGSTTTALTLSAVPSTTGRLYSYGRAGSSDRALGSLASGSTVPAVGLALENAGTVTHHRITVKYVREIWQVQGTSTANPFPDRLKFAWGIDPQGVTTGNFLTYPTLTPVESLDALSPGPNTLTGVAGGSTPDRSRDGAEVSWSQKVTGELTGLQWKPGQTLYLRWADRDNAGFDAGLALDDIEISAEPGPFPVPVSLVPAAQGQLKLEWRTLPGHSYQLQETQNLESWPTLQGAGGLAAGFEMRHSVSLGPGSRFYRILQSEASTPAQEVVFSAPGALGTEADLHLERKVIELLTLTPPGASVRAAIYTWTRETMAEAFIEAWQRGVDVRLVVGSDFPAVDLLLAAMPDRVSICRDAAGVANGCQGGRINHNKFVLFSGLTDGSSAVTVQSSANFTDEQLVNSNNLVIIRQDPALHAAYLQYWNDLASRPLNLNYYRTAVGAAGTQVWFFPRAEANGVTGSKDPIVEQLDAIDPIPGGSIRITMAFWTGARRAIAQRLAALEKAGMDVAVVTHPQETSAEILQILRAAGVRVILLDPIHSKYLLMDAVQGGVRRRSVFTGSHNYTGPALTENDETLLRLEHPRVFADFTSDWERLAAHPLAN